MKDPTILPVLLCVALFCACASANNQAAGNVVPGTLAVRLTTLHGMEGSSRDARIYVDGRFVGDYEPDEIALALSAGRHSVTVEVPRVYSRRGLPNGGTEMRAYSLKGEERIVWCSTARILNSKRSAMNTGINLNWPNNSVETNRRPASLIDAGRQFGIASCAPPFLSAAVAHLWR
jgi:hypothetical protein